MPPPRFRTSSVGYHRDDVDAFIRTMMNDHAPLRERVAELEATLEAAVQVLKGKSLTASASPQTSTVRETNETPRAAETEKVKETDTETMTDMEQDALVGSVLMSAQPASRGSKRLAYALVSLLVATAAVVAVKYFRTSVTHRSAASDAATVVGRADSAGTTRGITQSEPPGVPAVATSSGQPEAQPAGLLAGMPAAPAIAGGLTIFLTARERCWIRAMFDGDRKLERELDAGEHATVQARNEVVLRVGNAGAISVTINGVAALPLGRPGEPVTTRITADNYQRLLAAIPTASSLIARPEKSGPVSGTGPAHTPVG
jgi:hypothetical protein